ncbi:hypothetical protein BDW22DRAFT_51359 [Trametopsis cervina]|nr:hypothetical protein BDW22DRAFT_51359 [Trametopsis cervina]
MKMCCEGQCEVGRLQTRFFPTMATSPPRKKMKNASYYRNLSASILQRQRAAASEDDYDGVPEPDWEDDALDRPRRAEHVDDDAYEDGNFECKDEYELARAQSAAAEGICESPPPSSPASLCDENGLGPYESESDEEPDVPLSTVLKTPAHFPAQSSAPAALRMDDSQTPRDQREPVYAAAPVPAERDTRPSRKRTFPVPSPAATPPSSRGRRRVAGGRRRTHSAVSRPYPCLYKGCTDTFTLNGDRKRHLDAHFRGRWRCLRCKTPFGRRSGVKRHCGAQSSTSCAGGFEANEWEERERRWLTPELVLCLRVPNATDPLYDQVTAVMKEAREAGCTTPPDREPEPVASSSRKRSSVVRAVGPTVAADVLDLKDDEDEDEDEDEDKGEPEKTMGSDGKGKESMQSGGRVGTGTPVLTTHVPAVQPGVSTQKVSAGGMRDEGNLPLATPSQTKQVTQPLIYINLRDFRGHVRYSSMNPLPPTFNKPVPSLGEELDEFLDRFGFETKYIFNLYDARVQATTVDEFAGMLASVISTQEARWFWPRIRLPAKLVIRMREFERD